MSDIKKIQKEIEKKQNEILELIKNSGFEKDFFTFNFNVFYDKEENLYFPILNSNGNKILGYRVLNHVIEEKEVNELSTLIFEAINFKID